MGSIKEIARSRNVFPSSRLTFPLPDLGSIQESSRTTSKHFGNDRRPPSLCEECRHDKCHIEPLSKSLSDKLHSVRSALNQRLWCTDMAVPRGEAGKVCGSTPMFRVN